MTDERLSSTHLPKAAGATELVAVLVAATQGVAKVLTVAQGRALPSGPLSPIHRSLQAGVRAWVASQTHHPLGYVEQLYTFADTQRLTDAGHCVVYVSYLGLVREAAESLDEQATWQAWYDYFPWEDHREGRPVWLDTQVLPRLNRWAAQGTGLAQQQHRAQRVAMCFGEAEGSWNEESVLQRYELLYEVGLVPESPQYAAQAADELTILLGRSMWHDHRRVLATAMARLRAKIKYRPVIFELMPPEFTLLQLQQNVEALAGVGLHKQNFRRLMAHQNLIEATGAMAAQERGRPAQLYRFKENVLLERSMSGSKLPVAK
ncbi:MAG: hypothetical protein KBC57_02895 [Neisseriaceae bacterium]|nr:hypothetical protein [Neisseriaceae bacterium]MBP6861285.1 hypothetical protein [Neisseriaceae bacterium]